MIIWSCRRIKRSKLLTKRQEQEEEGEEVKGEGSAVIEITGILEARNLWNTIFWSLREKDGSDSSAKVPLMYQGDGKTFVSMQRSKE